MTTDKTWAETSTEEVVTEGSTEIVTEKEKPVEDLEDILTEEETGDETEDTEEEKEKKKNPNLVGLDVKEGKYRVQGIISARPIYLRKGKGKGPGTSLTKSSGYAIEEIETGRVKYVTKLEGVTIAARHGLRNGYIIQRKKNKKDSAGEIIKTEITTYLQPYPAVAESYTQDGRLIGIFEYDEDNRIKYPLNLLIEEEKCTRDMWMLIQKEYQKIKKRSGKKQKNTRGMGDELRKRTLEIEAEISKLDIPDPFDTD